jgi:hypothetical protein
MDTTGSMGGEIANLRAGLRGIIDAVRLRVSDPAFGVGKWEDYPISPYGSAGDLPWRLLRTPTTDAAAAQAGVDALSLGYGADWAESGYESLYQIATGAGTSWTGGSVPAFTGPGLGGVGFRTGSLPIVLHVTDAPSHQASEYTTGGIVAHTREQAFTALQALGIRVVTVNTDTTASAQVTTQLNEISTTTRAVVPVCAFRTGAATWRCGTDQCCTGLAGAAVPPVSGRCTLQYRVAGDGSGLGTAVVDGVDALVKYTTLDVYAVVRDDGIAETIDTACFIKRVEALRYVAPPAEPERSCTPVPAAAAFAGSAYHNGFRGYASGTSRVGVPGARLEFTVVAENDVCVVPGWEAQVYTAYIDVFDETTRTLLDTQEATIIVPPRVL